MNDDQIKSLTALREQLLGGIVPLIDSGSLEAAERFDLYSRLAQSRGELQYYQKAYEAAQDMNDSGDKLRAYLDLLGDVDFEIQSKSDESEPTEDTPTAPVSPTSIEVVSENDT